MADETSDAGASIRPACATCNDMDVMEMGGGEVMCLRCPPCHRTFPAGAEAALKTVACADLTARVAELEREHERHVATLKAINRKAIAAINEAKTRIAKLEAERDAATARAEALEAENERLRDAACDAVKAIVNGESLLAWKREEDFSAIKRWSRELLEVRERLSGLLAPATESK